MAAARGHGAVQRAAHLEGEIEAIRQVQEIIGDLQKQHSEWASSTAMRTVGHKHLDEGRAL